MCTSSARVRSNRYADGEIDVDIFQYEYPHIPNPTWGPRTRIALHGGLPRQYIRRSIHRVLTRAHSLLQQTAGQTGDR